MTVGQALASSTGLKLFHNHMTIEMVLPIFEFGTPPFGRLVHEFRSRIIEEVARSTLPGLIFTYVWDLDHPGDRVLIEGYADLFRNEGGDVYFVELQAPLAARLERNRTPERIKHKPSKSDLQASEARLLSNEHRHRMNTHGDFFYTERYLKLNNENLSPTEAALCIKDAFSW